MILVVNYKLSNIGSLLSMFKKIGAPARESSDPREILTADRLILPGVGHFAQGMRNLREMGLADALDEKVKSGTPILGICLGLQLMSHGSEEGDCAGFGWLAADTVRFRPEQAATPIKIPHVGWNEIEVKRDHPIFGPRATWHEDPLRFYFVHSFHLKAQDPAIVLATAGHGYRFDAALGQRNVFGVQFHPEKSHRFGINMLRRFAEAPLDALT